MLYKFKIYYLREIEIMTYKTCKKKIDYFIKEAIHLRETVLTFDGPSVCMDKEITDERFEIFQKDILSFIKKITKDEKYIRLYSKIAPYEYSVGKVQGLLMDLKAAVELMEIIEIK